MFTTAEMEEGKAARDNLEPVNSPSAEALLATPLFSRRRWARQHQQPVTPGRKMGPSHCVRPSGFPIIHAVRADSASVFNACRSLFR